MTILKSFYLFLLLLLLGLMVALLGQISDFTDIEQIVVFIFAFFVILGLMGFCAYMVCVVGTPRKKSFEVYLGAYFSFLLLIASFLKFWKRDYKDIIDIKKDTLNQNLIFLFKEEGLKNSESQLLSNVKAGMDEFSQIKIKEVINTSNIDLGETVKSLILITLGIIPLVLFLVVSFFIFAAPVINITYEVFPLLGIFLSNFSLIKSKEKITFVRLLLYLSGIILIVSPMGFVLGILN